MKNAPILFFVLCLLLSACAEERGAAAIPKLSKIKSSPVGHYRSTSAHSSAPNRQRAVLDEISFPDKTNVLVIKTISPEYLSKEEIKKLALELEPPANSSNQTKAELELLVELQQVRSKFQKNEALRMHDIVYFPIPGMNKTEDLFFQFTKIFGPNFNPENFPATEKLLNNIMKEMRVAEFTAKNHFLRPRPRQLEKRLKPLKKMSSSSFVSGHTLWAYMQAYLIGELIPDKRDDFLELAYDIGYSREALGVHYPSDEEASRKLAHKLLSKMWVKPNFTNDFYDAQKELNRPY